MVAARLARMVENNWYNVKKDCRIRQIKRFADGTWFVALKGVKPQVGEFIEIALDEHCLTAIVVTEW